MKKKIMAMLLSLSMAMQMTVYVGAGTDQGSFERDALNSADVYIESVPESEKCPECGEILAEDHACEKCPECGEILAEDHACEKCPDCGEILAEDHVCEKCPDCGEILAEDHVCEKCTECGEILAEDHVCEKCTECGEILAEDHACEKCPDCGEILAEDHACEKCPDCGEILAEDHVCEKCTDCGEILAEGHACEKCTDCGEILAEGHACEKCTDCGEILAEGHACEKCTVCQEYNCTVDHPTCLDCGETYVDTHECPMCATCRALNGEHAHNCVVNCECDYTDELHAEDCPLYAEEIVISVAEQLANTESLEDFRTVMMAEENREAVLDFTVDEIKILMDHVESMYNDIEEPSDDETCTYEEMIETMTYLPAMECPECGEFDGHAEDCANGQKQVLLPSGNILTRDGGTLTGGEYYLENNLSLVNNIIIDKNAKVTIDLNGMVLQGTGEPGISVITVNGGATLTILDSNPTEGHHGNITSEGLWEWKDGNYTSESKGGFIYNKGTGGGIQVSGGTLYMKGGTIAGCKAAHGAAIVGTSDAQLHIENARIIYNINTATSGSSGTIHNEPDYGDRASFLRITNSEISHNKGNSNGGAIFGYDVELKDCTIEYNEAKYGAGVYIKNANSSTKFGKLTVENCEIGNNTATGNGGGIYGEENSTITITDSEISQNEANHGGGIYGAVGSTITVNGASLITDNEAYGNGGGIYGYEVSLEGTEDQKIIVSGNKAPSNGGGIYGMGTAGETPADNKIGEVVIKYCEITRNRAGVAGGGIYTNTYCKLDVDDTNITYNDAIDFDLDKESFSAKTGRGGGAYVQNYSTFDNVHIDHNRALRYGGGLQVCEANGDAYLNSGSVSYNVAICDGAGGVHVTESCTFSMNGGEIIGNECYEVGGAIHASYEANVILENGIIQENITHTGRGGAIHVDVGVNLQIIGDTLITMNHAKSGQRANMVSIASTDPGAEVTVERNGTLMEGYGGAICVDSGTFEMSAGTITDNYASAGGGGVALVMIIMSKEQAYRNKVVHFDMTGGKITDNKTDGNGGGIYMMKNKIDSVDIQDSDMEGWSDDQKTKLEELKQGIPYLKITGGSINNNVADALGGGAYLEENTKFIIGSTGDISYNTAVDGAGVYVASGTAEIEGGTMRGNEASQHGGALYIKGNVTMSNGTIGGDNETDANIAVNGGAMYVTNGEVLIEHGTIIGNKAVSSDTDLQDPDTDTGRGGAVYLAGGNDIEMSVESGEISDNTADNDGGAIYATGGMIMIGLQDCRSETEEELKTCSHHKDKGEGRDHPVINGNSAGDTGGGIAISKTTDENGNAVSAGTVHFYCGTANENEALYKGVGMNVFMDGGEFYLYDGADVGTPHDPDLVIVGGKLENMCKDEVYVNLYYYSDNKEKEPAMIGLAEYDEVMNLPAGDYFMDPPAEGYAFLGWTAQGAESGDQSNEYVRNKEQYVNSGEPVRILDELVNNLDVILDDEEKQTAINTNRVFDGVTDNGDKGRIMHLYALWVPEEYKISYVNGLTGAPISNTDPENPATYTFDRFSNKIQIQPVEYPGYDLVGWYIYQDAGQNANWNDTQKDYEDGLFEPVEDEVDYHNLKKYLELKPHNGVLELEAGFTNFGDITLIAEYVPAYTSLEIKKVVDGTLDENQTFIFHVSGTTKIDNQEIDLHVTVCGTGSVTVNRLPVGVYTVTEQTDWSGRYGTTTVKNTTDITDSSEPITANSDVGIEIQALQAETEYQVTFTNTRTEDKWLDANASAINIFGVPTSSGKNEEYGG